MECVALDYFNNYNIVREDNSPSAFYSYICEYNKQYAPDTHAHLINLYQNIMYKYILKPNKPTVWEGGNGNAKQYRCVLAIYFMTIIY